MTTITNKKQYPSEQYLNELITNKEFAAIAPVEIVRVIAAELQERRKADNQEPAGYHVIKECGKVGCSVATLEEAEKTRDFWNKKWTIRPYFYSAAPAPVVPEEMPMPNALSMYAVDAVAAIAEVRGWNACRTAMLQGSQPVSNRDELQVIGWLRSDYNSDDKRDPNAPLFMLGRNDPSETWGVKYIPLSGNSPVIPDGWISCSERMPEDEQEVIVHNKLGYRYVSYFDEHSGLFFDMRGGNQMNCIEHILVTHWMPLPAAPEPDQS